MYVCVKEKSMEPGPSHPPILIWVLVNLHRYASFLRGTWPFKTAASCLEKMELCFPGDTTLRYPAVST